jgi:ribosomal protein L11 methyltransferase
MVLEMKLDSEKFAFDVAAVREYALRMVAESRVRMTPPVLEKKLREGFGISRKPIKSIVRDLVDSGELAYTYEYGTTFLERSFAKAVRISKHFVLQPPGIRSARGSDDVIVRIRPGAAFGAGNHPTTRLAIKGLEFLLYDDAVSTAANSAAVLDIGTGSGVLLISAVLGGCKSGLGLDIDACARAEAAENVNINEVGDRIVISERSLDEISDPYSIILANLRFPTLKRLRNKIEDSTEAGGFLLLSGIRDHEQEDLINSYHDVGFERRWAANELGWSGVVLQKGG